MNYPEVIVVPSRECPNPECDKQKQAKLGTDFECPNCHFGFCNQCFEVHAQGSGQTIRCPKCHQILKLPERK